MAEAFKTGNGPIAPLPTLLGTEPARLDQETGPEVPACFGPEDDARALQEAAQDRDTPAPRGTKAPHGLQAIIRAYGDIWVGKDKAGEWVVLTPGWESANLVKVQLPGAPGPRWLHKDVVGPATRALTACLALGDGYKLRTLGTFAPRVKRVVKGPAGTATPARDGLLSVHSWAAALDLNADTNPLAVARGPVAPVGARDKAGKVIRDIPDAWLDCFRREGFTCGADFGRPDPMHVQFCSGY